MLVMIRSRAEPEFPHIISRPMGWIRAICMDKAISFGGKVPRYGQRAAMPALSLLLVNQGPALTLRHPTIVMAIIASAFFVLLLIAALLWWRSRRADRQTMVGREFAKLAQRLNIAEALVQREQLCVAVWDAPDGAPRNLRNNLTEIGDIPADPESFTVFSDWLDVASAANLKNNLASLWRDGRVFSLTLTTRSGRKLLAQGLHTSSSAILALSQARVSGAGASANALDSLKALLELLPHPAWLQGENGALLWTNSAMARSAPALTEISGGTFMEALARPTAFIEALVKPAARQVLQAGKAWRERAMLTTPQGKRGFDVTLMPAGQMTVGLAFDISEFEAARGEQAAMLAAQQNAFKQLRTGIAVFGADQRLRYANPAWKDLWQIDEAFIADRPEEEAVLDRLRAARFLPEERDFTAWKANFLTRSRAGQVDDKWYLPQGRVLRIVSFLTADGGHTLINENLSELEDLRRHYATHQRIQRETFEALNDAVAVFGSDGRLQLSNPAFVTLWRLGEARHFSSLPHVDELVAWFGGQHDDQDLWARLKACIFALGEERASFNANFLRRDGLAIELFCRPLPGGATLVTFVDNTASVNVERALKERNKALEEADRLKDDFIQHISYELRSPLNNIIGFTEILAEPSLVNPSPGQNGLPKEKQHEYIGYIRDQSQVLLSIIDDILTLATIDAGVAALDVSRLDPVEVMTGAAAALRQKAAEAGVALQIETRGELGAFNGDQRRIRQVLYNLLSNAIGFSTPGKTVTLSASRDDKQFMIFEVRDEGAGIAAEDLPHIFERFESKPKGTSHRGVGLGLPVAKSFVEMHGGELEIRSEPGKGTQAICSFPLQPAS